jgi:hypothetical protein
VHICGRCEITFCGSTDERSDAPGNDFGLLRVEHSDTSREITMIALDICGNGTSVDQQWTR